MSTEQQELLRKILERSGEKVDEQKIDEVLADIDSLESIPRVEEVEYIIKRHFPDLELDQLTTDNSDLDGLLGTLGTGKTSGAGR